MLKYYVLLAQQDIQSITSEMNALKEIWKDKVAAHIEETYIDEIVSECNRFSSSAEADATIIREKENLLKDLASKY